MLKETIGMNMVQITIDMNTIQIPFDSSSDDVSDEVSKQSLYSVRSIELVANMDVSRVLDTKICLDTSILATSFMERMEYLTSLCDVVVLHGLVLIFSILVLNFSEYAQLSIFMSNIFVVLSATLSAGYAH
jgi:hypothetical protein